MRAAMPATGRTLCTGTALAGSGGARRVAPGGLTGSLAPAPWGLLGGLRFASKKAAGSTRNGRDSPGKRLGLKKSGGQRVEAGQIIIRQRGFKWRAGDNVHTGRDFTIHAKVAGHVHFTRTHVRGKKRTVCHVVPLGGSPADLTVVDKVIPHWLPKKRRLDQIKRSKPRSAIHMLC